ncbi:hypothetical protein AGMMS50293_08550 [Spirochaetia bacterium]|nr:hypothetical protein AGMMS50293_08550 [Spirochaetia bacterium]
MQKMNLNDVKMELVLPVFFGCLGALVLCALLAVRGPCLLHDSRADAAESPETKQVTTEEVYRFFMAAAEKGTDPVQEMYRQPETRGQVTDFFEEVCGSGEIAEAILANADSFDIPPALAFALGWEESRFNPMAINRKNRDESIDRGLFQLNSRSFPTLDSSAFFNASVNARHGMGHLRFCLDTGGSEIAALAMYNAGSGRVKTTGTPAVTLDYIHRILENRRKIEERFHDWFLYLEDPSGNLAEAKPEFPRFVRLAPLAGKM